MISQQEVAGTLRYCRIRGRPARLVLQMPVPVFLHGGSSNTEPGGSDRLQLALYTSPMTREFQDEHIPLGYLISLRSYGTWLHGDKRGSVNRFNNRFGTPMLPSNPGWRKQIRKTLSHAPVKLKSRQRVVIEDAIRETCRIRKWNFWTTNIRTNHVHTVVSAPCKPAKILSAFKANATRN